MFGFKLSASDSIRRSQTALKRDKTRYSRELSKIEADLLKLRKSLDIHIKNGNMDYAKKVAGDIVRLENKQTSLNSTIRDLQTAEDRTANLQSLASRATTQKNINAAQAVLLRTIDTKEVCRLKYDAEQQKDQIEMTEEALQELYEEDEDVVDTTASRVDHLLEVSLAKAVLEGTMPNTSSHIPSALPVSEDVSSLKVEAPIPSSPTQSSQSTSTTQPSISPTPQTSMSESDLQTRFQNLFK